MPVGGAFEMDELDGRILQELLTGGSRRFQGKRERLEAVASKVGVHRNTVTRRIARFQQNEFFLPLRLLPRPMALGGTLKRYRIELPSRSRTPANRQAVLEVPGIFMLLECADAWDIILIASSEAKAEAAAQAASSIVGGTDLRVELDLPRDRPSQPDELSRLERRLIDALVDDARVSFARIARQLKVSKRTIERHYQSLQERGLFSMWPAGGAPVARLTILHVTIHLSGSAQRRADARDALHRLLPNHLALDLLDRKAWFYLYGASVPRMMEQLREAAAIPGVTVVRSTVYEQGALSPRFSKWVKAALDELASQGRRGGSSPRGGPTTPG